MASVNAMALLDLPLTPQRAVVLVILREISILHSRLMDLPGKRRLLFIQH